MAEENQRKSLISSSGRGSFKTKNPLSRVKDEDDDKNKTGLFMRKSWSTDSLGLLNNNNHMGKTTCICAPTKHEGSFRCRLHRSSTPSHGSSTVQLHLPKPVLSSRRLDDQ